MSAPADEQPKEQRKLTKGKRRRDVNTNQLQVAEALRAKDLQGVILDTAVWVCGDQETTLQLDTLCLGNLDGGGGTAVAVRDQLAGSGVEIKGDQAVRLALEEAFFMAYAFRLLTVHEVVDGKAVALSITTLWQRMQQLRPDFLLLYLAYHHFRSKGWIPRTGLQYGVDCVLYQKHPALSHSEYAVLIMPLTAGLRPPIGWHDLQISNRLATQVSKKLLLFYVHEHIGSDRSSPRCLEHFAVHERLVRRFVPETYTGYN